MGFKCGIVGLPNVGKSTLFNALTASKNAEAANFPFCTIDPNIGIVDVVDKRLDQLAKLSSSKKKIYTNITFVEIASLVKGASKGEGLGYKFLSHIWEVDAIIKILEEKLNQLDKNQEVEINNDEENKFLSSIGLLSIKPKIIVCNVDEENLSKGNQYTEEVQNKYPNEKIIKICADIEDQLSGLDKSEKEAFMQEIGLNKTGINQLIKEGYDLLKLDTFFTSGPEESRAWTVRKNTIAPKAASVIHTDFEKNFIRAEAVSCEDFIKYGSAEKCKENGKLRIEGKDYIVKDGDVLYFRVNP